MRLPVDELEKTPTQPSFLGTRDGMLAPLNARYPTIARVPAPPVDDREDFEATESIALARAEKAEEDKGARGGLFRTPRQIFPSRRLRVVVDVSVKVHTIDRST